MVVCRFFQQGNCKFGNNCRNEHPRNQPSNNRFGAFGSGGNGGRGGPQDSLDKYAISTDTIKKDLTTELPQWILSSYGPGKNPPELLFGGFPREQSPEEVRLQFYQAKASGNEQQALSEAQVLYQNAQEQMQNAINNLDQAAKFIIEGENKQPNRHHICEQGTKGQPFGVFTVGQGNMSGAASSPFAAGGSTTQPSGFGQPSAPSGGSAFGQPSALGQRANPSFGSPAFGQPSQPQSGFGQASQPASSTPAFGQPSQPQSGFAQASQNKPAFGQSAFGQPSQLGAKPNPFGTPAFGQTSQPAPQQSAFGQPSQLGQQQSPFGAASNNSTNTNASPFSAFSGNNSNNNNNAGANPFGSQPGGQANTASPFASASNSTQGNQGGFGQPSQQPAQQSAFGQPSQLGQKPNPFASPTTNGDTQKPNPFAQAAQPSSPFGAPSQQQQQPQTNGGFGQPSSNANPFGQPRHSAVQAPTTTTEAANPYPPGSTREHPHISSYASKGMDGRLSQFKGKPVAYKDNLPGIQSPGSPWTRIWFPDGPPAYNKSTEVLVQKLDGPIKAQWDAFVQKGVFADGVMPEMPPPRDCVRWDF